MLLEHRGHLNGVLTQTLTRTIEFRPLRGLVGNTCIHLVLAQALESEHQTEPALQEYKLYLDEAPNGSNAAFARQAVARLSSVAAR